MEGKDDLESICLRFLTPGIRISIARKPGRTICDGCDGYNKLCKYYLPVKKHGSVYGKKP